MIYFDYEDPLQSNIVVNTIKYTGKPDVRSLHIFPNPATDLVNIVAGEIQKDIPLLHTIKISNFTGGVVLEINNREVYNIKAEIGQLAPGIYYLSGYDYDGQIYQGKLIKM